MRALKSRIEILEKSTRVKNSNKELPVQVQEMIRKIRQNAKHIVLTDEEQQESDRHAAEFVERIKRERIIQ